MAAIPPLPAAAVAAAKHELRLVNLWFQERHESLGLLREQLAELDEHMLVCDNCRTGENASVSWRGRMHLSQVIEAREEAALDIYERIECLEAQLGLEAH